MAEQRRAIRRMRPREYDEEPVEEEASAPAPSRRPVRRSNGDSAPSTPSRRPVRRQDDGDDEEQTIHGGWTDGQKQMDSASPFAQALKLDETGQFIKFAQDVPYANFRRHWIDRASPQGGTIRRPFTCLATVDRDCPLCDIGDRASAVSAFNIVVLGDDGQIVHKTLDAGARLFQVLKAYANDPKIGPLSKHYFLISKTGKNQNAQTNVTPIKTTALAEDWDMEPVDPDELAKVKLYTPDVIEMPTFKALNEIASEIADDYE